ncbi:MAG: adenosylmethionine--8-amino-7-oxononanoate transaminase [Francisellaceae bacterium]
MYSTSLWHPCSQMKDYEAFAPVDISHAQGSYLYDKSGKAIIDAISSWWCKSLGHGHPQLKNRLIKQMDTLEHTILANTTNSTIYALSERLCHKTKMNKALYASDGSSAVEIAVKLSIHSRKLKNEHQKTRFLALKNGYHGETTATLSISDLGLYNEPYAAIMWPKEQVHFIDAIPYVSGKNDPLWHDASEPWQKVEATLESFAETITALIVEPLIQGAGGMKIYSKDFLIRLCRWARSHDIHIIADEIMTGIGRTGKFIAFDYIDLRADFICLSKGLTGGMLPLSVCLTHDDIYQLFYDDYDTHKAFMHSHTHTGNTLAASVALSVLDVFEDENILSYVDTSLAPLLLKNMIEVEQKTNAITNIRALGGVIAADLINPDAIPRLGYKVYQKAVELGALLRPLSNTIYWLPPLNCEASVIESLKGITIAAINAVYENLNHKPQAESTLFY